MKNANISAAVVELRRMIDSGREYPDASASVAVRFRVSQDALGEAYDAADPDELADAAREPKWFTRADYMATIGADALAKAHRKYYLQFVDSRVLFIVESRIGIHAILQSRDPQNFNDIPLIKWDRLEPSIKDACLGRMAEINGIQAIGRQRVIPWSLGDAVCIAKEAARQIRQGSEDEQDLDLV